MTDLSSNVMEPDITSTIEEGVNVMTAILNTDEDPQPAWTLEKLQGYVVRLGKKIAVDVWRLGRALMFARRQIQKSDWKGWIAENCPGISYRTAMRYVELAKMYASFTDIEKDGIRQAYLKAGILKKEDGSKDASRKKTVAAKPTVLATGKTLKPKDELATLNAGHLATLGREDETEDKPPQAQAQMRTDASKDAQVPVDVCKDAPTVTPPPPASVAIKDAPLPVPEKVEAPIATEEATPEQDSPHRLVLTALCIARDIDASLTMQTKLKEQIGALMTVLEALERVSWARATSAA